MFDELEPDVFENEEVDEPKKKGKGRPKKTPKVEPIDPDELSLHGKPLSLSGLGFAKPTAAGEPFTATFNGKTLKLTFDGKYRVSVNEKPPETLFSLLELEQFVLNLSV